MKVLVVSDFNAELVSRYLAADSARPECEPVTAPFGQVFQSLNAAASAGDSDALFVWTRPEAVIEPYARLLGGEIVGATEILDSVAAFAGAVSNAAESARVTLAASWVPTTVGRGAGLLSWSAGGHASLLARMNLTLAEHLHRARNAHVLDAQHWLDVSRPARDAKNWFAAKCPFGEGVCRAAARDVKAAARAVTGLARKFVILDLDDTLWGGIVGEVGPDGLRLGGHDAIGEAHVEFQRALKALSRRGIALGVVSKNDEAVALDAIDKHSSMVLRRGDLAGWRINWQDKAQNIIDLARELNLGLDSVVFIDDNPTERGRVREALPDVLVPDWPADAARFADSLRELDCFDTLAVTAEDLARTQTYAQNRQRSESQTAAGSMEDWLATLGVRVVMEPFGPSNAKRVVQLLNKTNQLNMRTRRLTESELNAWLAEEPGRMLVAISVADRFGELGLTGLVSWEPAGEALEIVDFVLSCRAMGRGVEHLMAALAVKAAREDGKSRIVAPFIATPRNMPCLEFWRASGFAEESGPRFTWDASRDFPIPGFIEVSTPPAALAARA